MSYLELNETLEDHKQKTRDLHFRISAKSADESLQSDDLGDSIEFSGVTASSGNYTATLQKEDTGEVDKAYLVSADSGTASVTVTSDEVVITVTGADDFSTATGSDREFNLSVSYKTKS